MSITKIAKMTTEITANYQKLSDLNVAFYNQDVNTSILQFNVTRNNAPVSLGKVNVDGYIVLLAADGSRIQDTVEIVDGMEGVVQYTIPKEFLKHTGKVLGQVYIAVKGRDDTAVMRQISFDIKQDLLTGFSSSVKLEYIKTFDDLKEQIRERMNIIDDVIENGEDYVKQMNDAVLKGKDAIDETATDAVSTVDSKTKESTKAIDTAIKQLEKTKTQTLTLGRFFVDLYTETSLTVACIGTSLTYGSDGYSEDKRPVDTNTTDNGASHSNTRASITYPEALQKQLNSVFDNKVTVRNMGHGGDTTKLGYQNWNASKCDVALIEFGTNDGLQTLEDFIKYYRLIIERELLNDTAVILLAPPRPKNAFEKFRQTVAMYRKAVYTLAKEYNLPLVDLTEQMANFPAKVYVDTLHLNGKGYEMMASRISATFLGFGLDGNSRVSGGTSLGSRRVVDNMTIYDDLTVLNNAKNVTGSTLDTGVGSSVVVRKNQEIYYSFYADTGDLLVYPTLLFSNSSDTALYAECTLDFGVETNTMTNTLRLNNREPQPNYHPMNPVKIGNSDANGVSGSNTALTYSYQNINKLDYSKSIYVANKGWHVLKIKTLTGADDSVVYVQGLEFETHNNVLSKLNTGTYNVFNPPTVPSDIGDFVETRIQKRDLEISLGITFAYGQYYRNPFLKIRVENYDYNCIDYIAQIGNLTDATKFFLKEKAVTAFQEATAVTQRKITEISFDKSTEEFVLTWDSNFSLSRHAKIAITL